MTSSTSFPISNFFFSFFFSFLIAEYKFSAQKTELSAKLCFFRDSKMPSFLRRSIGLPPAIPVKSMSPDGLIAGLSSADNATRLTASGLRRTLSAADMCSKSGAIKRTASVEHLPGLVPADDDGGSGAFEDVWSSIQKKTEAAPARQSADVWTSILSEKAAAEDDVAKESCDVTAPPYVHPLVKRSASCLSEKSLEICTESLGSETGSDGFSSSELPEDQNDTVAVAEEQLAKHPEQLVEVGPTEEILEVALPRPAAVSAACRVNSVVAKKAAVSGRPLPPPLPSLSTEKGANLHMRSHRQNGRLVLEAVSVPTRNCFRAERQGGRLLLTFSDLNGPTPITDDEDVEEDDVEEEEDVNDDVDGEKVEELTDKQNGGVPMAAIAMENVLKSRGGMINYGHYKFLWLTRNNTVPGPWPNRLNKVVPTLVDEDDEEDECTLLIPAANTGALMNKYVYSWRNNTPATAMTSVLKVREEKDIDAPTPEELVVEATTKRATGPKEALEVYNKLLPFLRGCNEDIIGELKRQQPRRSLMLLRDTRCIATS